MGRSLSQEGSTGSCSVIHLGVKISYELNAGTRRDYSLSPKHSNNECIVYQKKKGRKKANRNDSYKMKIPMDKKRQNYKPVILPGSELGNDTFGVLTPIGWTRLKVEHLRQGTSQFNSTYIQGLGLFLLMKDDWKHPPTLLSPTPTVSQYSWGAISCANKGRT